MSWNNITPSWVLNSKLNEATAEYSAGEITKEEVYERIKDIKEIPNNVKENWNPDKEV